MSTFGIDLLLDSQKNQIKSKNDVLVIFIHWMLVKNKIRNVGIGDNVRQTFWWIINIIMNSYYYTYKYYDNIRFFVYQKSENSEWR